MNRLITRLQRRSRVAVGSSMALLVSLPLGAGVGLASSATAAPSTERAAATAPDDRATASDRTEKKQRKSETESALGDAVPWTADPAASAAAAAEESFDALLFSKTAAFRHSHIDEATTAIQGLAATNNFTVTLKLFWVASCWIAVVAAPMLSWRNAAVLEKRSASNDSSAAAAAEAFGSAVHGTASPRVLSALVGADFADVGEVFAESSGAEAAAGCGLGAAAAVEASPMVAPSGNDTIKAMVEPTATRERLCSRVMSLFITIPSLVTDVRSISSGAGPRAFGPRRAVKRCCGRADGTDVRPAGSAPAGPTVVGQRTPIRCSSASWSSASWPTLRVASPSTSYDAARRSASDSPSARVGVRSVSTSAAARAATTSGSARKARTLSRRIR